MVGVGSRPASKEAASFPLLNETSKLVSFKIKPTMGNMQTNTVDVFGRTGPSSVSGSLWKPCPS